MSPEILQKVVADYFAATRAMDREAWVATFAADAVSYDPVGAPPMKGHDAFRRFFDGITGAFERVGLTENQVFIAGDSAAVKWTGNGVGKNGRAVTFEGIDVFEIDGAGKIRELRAWWDPAAMMAELMG
ncbi:MAG TPA: nuclear transport factor 2 family protein [Blastocatellia bacterium]|nr:nuclear transport factor 2 family protein [Blastocatellia bacterium]